MKRVYALYVNFTPDNPEEPKIRIEYKTHWMNQLAYVESYAENSVLKWNLHYYLSTSRSALKKKAKQLIQEQIDSLQEEIETLKEMQEGL